MPRKYIGNPVLKEFEGDLFPIPEQWNKYLTHLYGDYMKLPPKELQNLIIKILNKKEGNKKNDIWSNFSWWYWFKNEYC